MVSLSLKDIERGVGADLFRRPIITAIINAFLLRLYFDTLLELPDSDPTDADIEDLKRKSSFLNLDPPLPGSYDAIQLQKRDTNHALIEQLAASLIFIAGNVLRLAGIAETVAWIALAVVFKALGLPRIYAFEKLLLDVRAAILPHSIRYIDRNVRLISHPEMPLPKLIATRRGLPFMQITIITSSETVTRDTEDLLRLLRYINRMTIAYWTNDTVLLIGRNESLVEALCNLNKKPVFVDLGWHKDVIESTTLKISVTFMRDQFPPSHPHPHALSEPSPNPYPTPAIDAIEVTSEVDGPSSYQEQQATNHVRPTKSDTMNPEEDNAPEITPVHNTASSNSVIVNIQEPESSLTNQSFTDRSRRPSSTHSNIRFSAASATDPKPKSMSMFSVPSIRRASSKRYQQLHSHTKSPINAISKRTIKVQLEMEASIRNLELLLISMDQFGTICESAEPGKRQFNGKRFAIFTVGILFALLLILYYQDMELRRPEIDLLTLAFGLYTIWMTVGKSAAFGEVEEDTPLNTVTRENILMAFHGLVALPKNVINVCWIPEVYRRDRPETNEEEKFEFDDDQIAEDLKSHDDENESKITKLGNHPVTEEDLIDGSISLMEAAVYLNIYYHYGHLIKWKGPRLQLDRYDVIEEEGDYDGVGHVVVVDRVSSLSQLKYIGESRTLQRLGGSGRKRRCRHVRCNSP